MSVEAQVDPFALLGVPAQFDLDLQAAESRYRELTRALHPDRHAQADAPTRQSALSRSIDVNTAWRAVRDPFSRCEALAARLGVQLDEHGRSTPDTWLMGMLELREQLEDAHAQKDRATVDAIRAQATAAISSLFGAFASAAASEQRTEVALLLARLRYLRRLQEDVSAIEESLEEAHRA